MHYLTCNLDDLIACARRHGVVFHLNPHDDTAIIYNHRDPAMLPLVEAMRARREEITDSLRLNQSRQPVRIAVARTQYHRTVLHEPDDLIVGDLTWRDLTPLIDRRVAERFAVERANDAREKERQR
jgi:hypothetical protein